MTPCLAKQRVREDKERERRALFLPGAWFAKEKGNEKNTHMDSLIFSPISEERQMWANGKQIPTFFFPSNYLSNQTKDLFYPPCVLPPFLAFPSIFPQTIVLTIYTIKFHPTLQDQMQCPPPTHPQKKHQMYIYTHKSNQQLLKYRQSRGLSLFHYQLVKLIGHK